MAAVHRIRTALLIGGSIASAACSTHTPAAGGTGNSASPPAATKSVATHTESTPKHNKRPHELYSYRDVLALLLQDDSVVPAAPPVHPVHTLYNREAVVPSMCYTRTEGTHNPCYVCHQDQIAGRPNSKNDADLQEAYSFSDVGTRNHWSNLFEDRSEHVAAISDEEISAFIEQDNYSELAGRLREVGFKGYVPDLQDLQLAAAAFDDEGFARDGSHWVAFNYKPLPSTFWPTNGSTDDVMIRLPQVYRTDADGKDSRDVYKANLALVEANIKGLRSITVSGIDEQNIGVDLDGNGHLGKISRITRTKEYVGAATPYFMLPFMYPQDTEFLHSVRYVGVDEQGNIVTPKRMKELRYMRKRWAVSKPQLYERYIREQVAKDNGQLPGFINRGQFGLDNEMGWVIQGFIENKNGRLRAQNFEETFFCMGCHSSLGSTIDSTFSFARKVDGAAGWGYLNLHGMPDAPSAGEERGEIATYLERVGGGGEFRSNAEMQQRWFNADGSIKHEALSRATDVYTLITPSPERALQLNKAYRTIVQDQDFIFGRDASVSAPTNVYDVVDANKAPTLPEQRTYRWDIRLNWPGHGATRKAPAAAVAKK